jgi:competence protein ComEC
VSRPWLAISAVVWLVASLFSSGTGPDPLPPGRFEGKVTLRTDIFDGQFGQWAVGEIAAGLVLVDFDGALGAGRGDALDVVGQIKGSPGRAAGRPYRATLTLRAVSAVEPSDFLPHLAGRSIRATVLNRLRPFDDGRALLSGFLIGETSHIAEADVDAMRRSGLAHFVAVSGSNVALFLSLLALAAGPLAIGPRRRALLGLAALPIYVAATRFEPSVMRASFMAGIALGGRVFGFVLEAWQLLALAVAVLVLTNPGLTSNVGFQLSVAATAGVVVGARWPVRGRVLRALTITMGAQLAVAPLLLVHFGSVPLLSPLINLVAAPVVAGSTVVGAIGVAGLAFLVGPAAWLADVVLLLARGAASWPQLTGWELAALLGVAVVVRRLPSLRVVTAIAASAALVLTLMAPAANLAPGTVVVLDVGQGDAILVSGGGDRYALVDGGPDEAILLDKLRGYGVRTIELVVLSHVHADHATGLAALPGSVAVGEVWVDTEHHSTPASRHLIERLHDAGVRTSVPEPGDRRRLGQLELIVAGPVRRYSSANDQSIVIEVRGPRRSMLLTGDIERYAQADLDHLRADVLKVPHHGAGTSDRGWLVGVGADLAAISVGPNDFGHPEEWVVETLEGSGTEMLRTDRDGDLIIDLASR